jgi:hypothetical protein
MSPSKSKAARSVLGSTLWLTVLLCASLLAWRLDFRVAQYHPSSASAAVAFYDANERNTASLDTAFPQSLVVLSDRVQLFSLAPLEKALALPSARPDGPDTPTALPDLFLCSASLFSNPPPFSLA